MPSSTPTSAPAAPAIGTFIDDSNLQLVSVLGVGGYGVVYKAIPTQFAYAAGLTQKTYAVKCLVNCQSPRKAARQRELHLREITLHRHASAHPGVITLHRVVEQDGCTFIVMDYAPAGDLFTQILNRCTYLGDDLIIKDVFLQLLDAVQYCHSELGVYHRDLKPENILCFEDGARVAITDFGLATTDTLSQEYKTGSVYHMSPECQAAEAAYSPLANDVWSLGIILLNLATGRNPWKSATPADTTYLAYLQDPLNFIPTVLPISRELNSVLVRMLHPDWRLRPSLDDVRDSIAEIGTFYASQVVFAGSMAQCAWEVGLDADESSESEGSTKASMFQGDEANKSRWSADSALSDHSDVLPKPEQEEDLSPCDVDDSSWVSRLGGFSWAASSTSLPDCPPSPSLSCSTSASIPSMPPTPNYLDTRFDRQMDLPSNSKPLKLDTNFDAYYDPSYSDDGTSMLMHSAIESCGIPSDLFTTTEDGEIEMGEIDDEDRDMYEESVWNHPYNIFVPSVWNQSKNELKASPEVSSPMDCDTPVAWWPKFTPSTQPVSVPQPRQRHFRSLSPWSVEVEGIEVELRTPTVEPPAPAPTPVFSPKSRSGMSTSTSASKKASKGSNTQRPRFWSKLFAACT